MTESQTVELMGHIIDSGMMERCFTVIMEMGGSFEVEEFQIGRHKHEGSYARMEVTAPTEFELQEILHQLNQSGATLEKPVDASLTSAPDDMVVPSGFYSTTNHPTDIRYNGDWVTVENIEMDCAVVVDEDSNRAFTKTLNSIVRGDQVVVGEAGIRVRPPERPRDPGEVFGFMQGGVSSERPSMSLIEKIADAMRVTKERGGRIIAVPGPAVVHSGARNDLAALINSGYIDGICTGNGFAVHDLERDIYGTSLGMDVETLEHPRKGHKHHIYTISEIIRAGGIERAIETDIISGGVMYECVSNDVPFVLAGSIRDDGPLPETTTDSIQAQNEIRSMVRDADLVIMLATLLHSVAVGNCLPSTTRTVCVDINPSTVTQLLDRGSAHAIGMVTDVGTFVPLLTEQLV